MDKRDVIVEATCSLLASTGIARITVALVAEASHVSSALVHYHFATKQKLLAAAAESLSRRRTERRVAALAGSRGLSGIDALWAVLTDLHASGERTGPDLSLLARQDRAIATALQRSRRLEHTRLAEPLAALFDSLGTRPSIPPEELAATVCMFLDGAGAALLAGVPADDVRASYDAFWLALVALGQAAPRAR